MKQQSLKYEKVYRLILEFNGKKSTHDILALAHAAGMPEVTLKTVYNCIKDLRDKGAKIKLPHAAKVHKPRKRQSALMDLVTEYQKPEPVRKRASYMDPNNPGYTLSGKKMGRAPGHTKEQWKFPKDKALTFGTVGKALKKGYIPLEKVGSLLDMNPKDKVIATPHGGDEIDELMKLKEKPFDILRQSELPKGATVIMRDGTYTTFKGGTEWEMPDGKVKFGTMNGFKKVDDHFEIVSKTEELENSLL